MSSISDRLFTGSIGAEFAQTNPKHPQIGPAPFSLFTSCIPASEAMPPPFRQEDLESYQLVAMRALERCYEQTKQPPLHPVYKDRMIAYIIRVMPDYLNKQIHRTSLAPITYSKDELDEYKKQAHKIRNEFTALHNLEATAKDLLHILHFNLNLLCTDEDDPMLYYLLNYLEPHLVKMNKGENSIKRREVDAILVSLAYVLRQGWPQDILMQKPRRFEWQILNNASRGVSHTMKLVIDLLMPLLLLDLKHRGIIPSLYEAISNYCDQQQVIASLRHNAIFHPHLSTQQLKLMANSILLLIMEEEEKEVLRKFNIQLQNFPASRVIKETMDRHLRGIIDAFHDKAKRNSIFQLIIRVYLQDKFSFILKNMKNIPTLLDEASSNLCWNKILAAFSSLIERLLKEATRREKAIERVHWAVPAKEFVEDEEVKTLFS